MFSISEITPRNRYNFHNYVVDNHVLSEVNPVNDPVKKSYQFFGSCSQQSSAI